MDKKLLDIAMRLLYIIDDEGSTSLVEVLMGEGYTSEEAMAFMEKVRG